MTSEHHPCSSSTTMGALRRVVLLAALLSARAAAQGHGLSQAQLRPVTIQDSIEMVRIQQPYDPSDPSAVFSEDDRQFVAVVWRGNLATNVNDYTALLFDAEHLQKPPTKLLSVSYAYSPTDQHARPLSQFAFLPNNHLAALARLQGESAQAVSIDLRTRTVTTLTRHPGGLLAFAVGKMGGPLIYAARSPLDEAKQAALFREGFSLEDRGSIADKTTLVQLSQIDWFRPNVEYFLLSKPGAVARKICVGPTLKPGDPQEPSHIWLAPDGAHAVVIYVPQPGADETLGLVDMATGSVEGLLPEVAPFRGTVLWARDSRSLVAFYASSSGTSVLSKIDLESRHVSSVTVGDRLEEWAVLGWGASGDEIILNRGMFAIQGDPERTLATVRLTKDGWEAPRKIPRADTQFDLNPRYYSGTNGRLIVGVKDDLTDAPELAAYDLRSKQTRVLTNLNPQLRRLKYGEVSRLNWTGPSGDKSFGYLIKPVGYIAGKTYPLIIQIKDETYDPEDHSFIIDGQQQYSGAAIQVWANAGFMILFTPDPLLAQGPSEKQEDDRITEHIDDGITALELQGLIDRERIGITGWSRAGWYSEYVVTHSNAHFAAATNIDNVEFNLFRYGLTYPMGWDFVARNWSGERPWGETAARWKEQAIDFRYDKAQTPRLIEGHGYRNVTAYGEIFAALKTARIPVEFYLYPDAPHDLKSPLHRLHSLQTHTDWFRFWLQGYEDPLPEKRPQYVRWRKMREDWLAAQTVSQVRR